MARPEGGEFDNSDYQKELAERLLKKLNNQPDCPRSPAEIYESYFQPLPGPCTEELIEYLIERLVSHCDAPVEWCDEDPDCIAIIRSSRVSSYIQTHLYTEGDPFPEVDPEPFRDRDS